MIKKYRVLFWILKALIVTGFAIPAFADEDGDEQYEHHEKRKKSSKYVYTVKENAVYKQECSSCHYLYNPGLLTEASWEAVMKGQAKHFGENLALDQDASSEILGYLKANSAEKTSTEWGRKITRSSGSRAYLRISEVPWILKEHNEISDAVFKRPSIKSRANCVACHQNAAQGNFEEHSVTIPKN